MRVISLVLTIFSIAIFSFSCDTDNDLDLEEGTYKGTFTANYSSGAQTGQTTLKLKDGRFSCSGNSNRIPAGGSGTYSFDNGKITFNDENFWTADFDWNVVLSGRYKYVIDGEKLKMSDDESSVGLYIYDLERQ